MGRLTFCWSLGALLACGPATGVIDEGPAEGAASAEQQVVLSFPKGRLFVTGNSGDVAVVNLTTNAVERTIPLPGEQPTLAISPDRSVVYAASGSAQRVLAIEGTRVTTRQYGGNLEPSGLAVNPAGTLLMVGLGGVMDLVVTADLQEPVVMEIGSTGISPMVWARTDAGSTLFTFPSFVGASAEDPPEIGYRKYAPFVNSTWKTISYPYVPRPSGPQGHGFFDAAYQPANDFVIGVDGQVDRLEVFQASTATYVGAIPTGDLPAGIGIQPRTAFVWVTSLRPEKLTVFAVTQSVFEPLLVTQVAQLPLPCSLPLGVGFSETEARAFVACEDKLVELSTVTRSITGTIPLAKGAARLVWAP